MRLKRKRAPLIFSYMLAAILLAWAGHQGISRYYEHLLQQQLHAYVVEQQARLKWMMQAQLRNLQDELLLAALTFSRLPDVRAILSGAQRNSETIRQVLSAWTTRSHYATLWVQIISPDGVSRYRSWTAKQGDPLLQVRPDLRQVLEQPVPTTTLSIGKYALTAKAIVPVYEGQKLLGLLEVISDLRPLIRALQREQFLAAVLVESRFANQLSEAGQLTRIGNWLVLQSVDDPALFDYLRHVDLDRLAQQGVLLDFEHDLGWWWIPIQTTAQGEVGALVTTQALARHRAQLVALFEREQRLWRVVILLLALVLPMLGVLAFVLLIEHRQLSHAFNAGLEMRMMLRNGRAVRINARLRKALERAGVNVEDFMAAPFAYMTMIPAEDKTDQWPDILAYLTEHAREPVPVVVYMDEQARAFLAVLTPMGRNTSLLSLVDQAELCERRPSPVEIIGRPAGEGTPAK